MGLIKSKLALTKAQKEALKLLASEGGLAKNQIHHKTFKSLVDLGLVRSSGALTSDGEEVAAKRGPGRPSNGTRQQIPITLPVAKLKRLDEERGRESRASFIEALLDQHWAEQS